MRIRATTQTTLALLTAVLGLASCNYDLGQSAGYSAAAGTARAGGSGGSSDGPVVNLKLFVTNEAVNFGTLDGALGGRVGANTLCQNEVTNNRGGLGCTTTIAFLSISGADQIRDFPTIHGFSSSSPVQNATGGTLATAYALMIAGAGTTLSAQITATQIAQAWTGSNSDGTVHANNCTGFTTNAAGTGRSGTVMSQTASYIDNANDNCAFQNEIYCLCW